MLITEEDGTLAYKSCSSFKSPILNGSVDAIMLVIHDIPTIALALVMFIVVGIPMRLAGYSLYKCLAGLSQNSVIEPFWSQVEKIKNYG